MGFYDAFGVTVADIISTGSTELDEIKDIVGYSMGTAWGGDLGVDWRYQSKNSIFAVGFSALDITNTEFEGEEKVSDQKMSLNFGTSLTVKPNRWVDGTVSFDLHPMGEDIDFIEKVHVGIRLGIPLLDFYAGYNAGIAVMELFYTFFL